MKGESGQRPRRQSESKQLKRSARSMLLSLVLAALLGSIIAAPAAAAALRRVNAPYFTSGVIASQSAVFWFGRITPTENYADVRVGYNASSLVIRVAVSDRRLWYDTTPAAADMEAWDAATVYLDLDGPSGAAPDASAFRLVAQLNFWESRTAYQTSYRGNGTGWTLTPIAFTATTGWRGDEPNTNVDDRGWVAVFTIPFSALGLNTVPAPGAAWGLGVSLHDRDDSSGTAIPVKAWPETFVATRSATWGELVFGLPAPYSPKPYVATSVQTTTIRDRLNGVTVIDGAVGGHTNCGSGLDFWTQWGLKTYTGLWTFNIQNQGDIADWPCNSKYYVSFPIAPIPAGKVIVRAVMTLYQFGGAGAGWNPPAQPSLIQAFTTTEAWDQNTLAWNNAPLASRFVAQTWVDPTSVYLGQPGKPWQWDVTSAFAEAYAAGKPMALALYEADMAYHSGKYFRASEEEEYDAIGRPTLQVTWGDPVAEVYGYASPTDVDTGETIIYNIIIKGSGAPLQLTGALPTGVAQPVSVTAGLTMSTLGVFSWTGTPAYGTTVRLAFEANVVQSLAGALATRTVLTQTSPTATIVRTASAVAFVDPRKTYLPVAMLNGR